MFGRRGSKADDRLDLLIVASVTAVMLSITIHGVACFSLANVGSSEIRRKLQLRPERKSLERGEQRQEWLRTSSCTKPSSSYPWSNPCLFSSSRGFGSKEKPSKKQHAKKQIQRRQREMSTLDQWASEHGVRFHKNVQLISSSQNSRNDNLDGEEDWSIALTHPCKRGTVMLTVPKSLVFSSNNIFENELLESTSSLSSYKDSLKGYEQHLPEFALLFKLLLEQSKGTSSRWHTWISSLPQSFTTTGICMDEVESSCLPSFATTLLMYERQKLQIFRKALYELQAANFNNLFDSMSLDDDMIDWAFNVVTTRCWKYEDEKQEGGNAVIVPLGDMFNHNDPPNVSVRDFDKSNNNNDDDAKDGNGSNDHFNMIEFVLAEDIAVNSTPQSEQSPQQLFLSYGMETNPHRFLIHFGFCYDAIPKIFCQITFPSPSDELVRLGCNDRSKMVYYAKDGCISDTVYFVVLFMLLAQVPNDQEEFYCAFVGRDKEKVAGMLEKYALEVCLALRNHVVQTREELDGLIEHIDSIEKEMAESTSFEGSKSGKAKMNRKIQEHRHPRLSQIKRHNTFLRDILERVRRRLDDRVENEKKKRKDQLQRQ